MKPATLPAVASADALDAEGKTRFMAGDAAGAEASFSQAIALLDGMEEASGMQETIRKLYSNRGKTRHAQCRYDAALDDFLASLFLTTKTADRDRLHSVAELSADALLGQLLGVPAGDGGGEASTLRHAKTVDVAVVDRAVHTTRLAVGSFRTSSLLDMVGDVLEKRYAAQTRNVTMQQKVAQNGWYASDAFTVEELLARCRAHLFVVSKSTQSLREAIRCALAVLHAAPRTDEAWSMLGSAMVEGQTEVVAGEPVTRWDCCLRAIGLNPRSFTSWFCLGAIMAGRRRAASRGKPCWT
jgi:tetratricopeptide (TPR) repeat protein